MEFQPIGFLESCYKDKFGTPRQPGLVSEAWSRLKIRGDLQPQEALDGLSGFSHAWLIFVFHGNENKKYHSKVHPPRMGGKTIGVFATRSPHRPNPIGLSLVKIHKVENDAVYFSGADLIDGTPILDLKPYLPNVESLPEAQAGWTSEASQSDWTVQFLPEVQENLSQLRNLHPEVSVEKIIEETLKLDPRPLVYRGYEEDENAPYRKTHAVRIFEGDIHFRFLKNNTIEVFQIII